MRATPSWCNLAKIQPYNSHLLFSDQIAPVVMFPFAKQTKIASEIFVIAATISHYHHLQNIVRKWLLFLLKTW
jgi:hypothetical protein